MSRIDPNSEAGRAVMKAYGATTWLMRCANRSELEIDEFRKAIFEAPSIDAACVEIERMTGGRVTVHLPREAAE